LLPHLLFKIFAIEDIPFTASWRYVTRKRKDLLADYVVNMILLLKKVMYNPFSLAEAASLMGEIRKLPFPKTVDD
jgi:hypothetical protein